MLVSLFEHFYHFFITRFLLFYHCSWAFFSACDICARSQSSHDNIIWNNFYPVMKLCMEFLKAFHDQMWFFSLNLIQNNSGDAIVFRRILSDIQHSKFVAIMVSWYFDKDRVDRLIEFCNVHKSWFVVYGLIGWGRHSEYVCYHVRCNCDLSSVVF